jgi:tRNA pseudouridine55 synthase
MDSILIIDKPCGITSHDVIDIIRKKLGIKKVGHCGTLDPMATGVLVVVTGKETKQSAKLSCDDKEYTCQIRFGASTDTHDSTGRIEQYRTIENLDPLTIRKTIMSFKGRQLQVPPMISAKYHKGQRLYRLARKGVVVKRQPVEIDIKDIRIIDIQKDSAELEIVCSKGTYIRTLCNDIGEKLGCGAHMSGLRRTRSGRFHIQDAKTLEDI